MSLVPVIDLFAGAGGLGDGFAAVRRPTGESAFRMALSIEKDGPATRTLRTRVVRRHLEALGTLDPYYQLLRGELSREAFAEFPAVKDADRIARSEVLQAELGAVPASDVDARIRAAVRGDANWVLIGGPPCQAYSIAGRSRRARDASFASDQRHLLYTEYLRILRAHTPAVFVMENVKGLLSATHGGLPMFQRILDDLSSPLKGVHYEIRSLVVPRCASAISPEDYVIRSERYGIPQARHRIVLLGVRTDFAQRPFRVLRPSAVEHAMWHVLGAMPVIRSRLSRGIDSHLVWQDTLQATARRVRGSGVQAEGRLIRLMNRAARDADRVLSTGSAFMPTDTSLAGVPQLLRSWLEAPSLGGVIQHHGRSHMPADLMRYLFAASFADMSGVSPSLGDFPAALLPAHSNAAIGTGGLAFGDRFRVQVRQRPASTVVSHISKDGHYYIHPDARQARSLTVREAARLQTFPEDYLFEGTQIEQYQQVGNAVPPLLAHQISEIVADLVGRPAPVAATRDAEQLHQVLRDELTTDPVAG